LLLAAGGFDDLIITVFNVFAIWCLCCQCVALFLVTSVPFVTYWNVVKYTTEGLLIFVASVIAESAQLLFCSRHCVE